MKSKKIAVLFGGISREREISLLSGQAVLTALQAAGYNAHAFDPANRSMQELKSEGFELCMINLHGHGGEDGTVQGALQLLGIPYSGSGVQASSIAIDKQMTKRLWQTAAIPVPFGEMARSVVQTEAIFQRLRREGHRMIVKPALEGSSLGLTRVSELAQCAAAFEAASQIDGTALCETVIEGPEVTAAVLEINGKARVLPLIRIEAPEGNYDYTNKYFRDEVKYHIPSGLPLQEEQYIGSLVLEAFSTLGCRGWGRVDVMIDARTRKPYLLELNTSPGMTAHSLVPMAAQACGMNFLQLCETVLRSARLDPMSTQGRAP